MARNEQRQLTIGLGQPQAVQDGAELRTYSFGPDDESGGVCRERCAVFPQRFPQILSFARQCAIEISGDQSRSFVLQDTVAKSR